MSRTSDEHFLGGNRREDTPVPIPNTVVKLSTADGTCFKRNWESMKLPGLIEDRGSGQSKRPDRLRFGRFLLMKPSFYFVDNKIRKEI